MDRPPSMSSSNSYTSPIQHTSPHSPPFVPSFCTVTSELYGDGGEHNNTCGQSAKLRHPHHSQHFVPLPHYKNRYTSYTDRPTTLPDDPYMRTGLKVRREMCGHDGMFDITDSHQRRWLFYWRPYSAMNFYCTLQTRNRETKPIAQHCILTDT